MNRLILDKYQTEFLSTELPSLTALSSPKICISYLQKPTAYSMV